MSKEDWITSEKRRWKKEDYCQYRQEQFFSSHYYLNNCKWLKSSTWHWDTDFLIIPITKFEAGLERCWDEWFKYNLDANFLLGQRNCFSINKIDTNRNWRVIDFPFGESYCLIPCVIQLNDVSRLYAERNWNILLEQMWHQKSWFQPISS